MKNNIGIKFMFSNIMTILSFCARWVTHHSASQTQFAWRKVYLDSDLRVGCQRVDCFVNDMTGFMIPLTRYLLKFSEVKSFILPAYPRLRGGFSIPDWLFLTSVGRYDILSAAISYFLHSLD